MRTSPPKSCCPLLSQFRPHKLSLWRLTGKLTEYLPHLRLALVAMRAYRGEHRTSLAGRCLRLKPCYVCTVGGETEIHETHVRPSFGHLPPPARMMPGRNLSERWCSGRGSTSRSKNAGKLCGKSSVCRIGNWNIECIERGWSGVTWSGRWTGRRYLLFSACVVISAGCNVYVPSSSLPPALSLSSVFTFLLLDPVCLVSVSRRLCASRQRMPGHASAFGNLSVRYLGDRYQYTHPPFRHAST